MINQTMYVDIHVLQTVPPSCVNRDDTGSPKTALYGGTSRARVSSQAWKHAMREMFTQMFSEEQLGKRTKHIVSLVTDKILYVRPGENSDKINNEVLQIFKDAGFKMKDIESGTDALFFMSDKQAAALADIYLSKTEQGASYKDNLKKALCDNPSIDIALFGRMVASDPSLNYDAAAQVAHAISTHAVQTEYDYFTAVDDCAPEDNSGAAHLGTVEFNSATLYRYASVNVTELARHLGDATSDVVKKFIEAFVLSMPTGKQNTFANRTIPDMVYIAVRKDQPVNMSGAFEKAVPGGPDGYVKKSEEAFETYAEFIYRTYVDRPAIEYLVGAKSNVESVKEMNLKEAEAALEKTVQEYISED